MLFSLSAVSDVLNYIFSVIYVVVFLLRLATLPHVKYTLAYWRDSWTKLLLLTVEILVLSDRECKGH